MRPDDDDACDALRCAAEEQRVKRCVVAMGPVPLSPAIRRLTRQFVRLLEDALTTEIAVIVSSSYAELRGLVDRGEAAISWLPPALYAQCATEGRVRLVACAERREPLHGALCVRADAPWQTLDDLKGVGFTAGWVDPLSCSGFLYPRLTLRERGLTSFSGEHHLGSHRSVAQAVARGRVQLGATHVSASGHIGRDLDLDVSDLRLLATTAPIPPDAICTSPEVSEANRSRLARVLCGELAASEDGSAILEELFQVNEFRPAVGDEFAGVIQAIAAEAEISR